MNVALIGSVSSSYHALAALMRGGVEITCVLGLDESRADAVSDYHSLRELAGSAGLPFLAFTRIGDAHVEHFLRMHTPDLLWVIGLAQMVPDRLICMARHGGVGFHPTMLPHGRGRAPVAWTILKGEPAAVNLFFLTDEPDAGDIIVQREVPVLPHDYSEDLIERTNKLLAEAITDLVPAIKAGELPRTPQDHSKATYYPKRTPADGLIHWSNSSDAIYRLVRAAGRPYPGAFSHLGERKITIWRALPARPGDLGPGPPDGPVGVILAADPHAGALVRTGDGGLWLTELQMERDEESGPADTLRVGDRLGSADRSAHDEGLPT